MMNTHLITSVLLLLHFGGTGVHSTFTNEFISNIEGGPEVADNLAASYGYINFGEIENFPDHYVFHHLATEKRSIRPSRGDHTAIKHEAAVNWIEQQKIRKRVKRGVERINDPKYPQQWYMNRKDAPNMNVEPAWEMGYTGKGIVVSILDDGIDYTHPDLAKNYDPLASCDINSHDDDPMPSANYDQTNRHGTRCAGEVAMEAGNNICGVGVAYNASIGGIRMLDDQVTDRVEGSSLAARRNHIDIYSASWGPEDNGMTVDGPGRLAKKAFHDGIKKGRGGKGNIFVWASGNGGRAKDNCGCDGYTNSIYTISVSSTSERGEAPWYLEECASTLATTYSSGSPKEKKVITTDLGGRCTDDHTGTSASAPLAAGLCALALQSNSNMTWRDMQYVIVMTSHNNSLNDGGWLVNGAGYSFSHRYGFGLMDAGAMVQLARNWINLPEQLSCEISLISSSREIKGRGMLATFTLNTTACENGPIYLEHVQSTVDVTFGSRGALVLTLVSPSGTHSKLLGIRPKDRRKGSFSSWPFMSTHFWGERAKGVWTLQVENGLPKSNSGQFRGWVLTLCGTDSLPTTATPPKKPAIRQGSKSPIKEMIDDVDHSRVAIPRSSDYSPCHPECFNSCSGPLASDCWKCLHYRDRKTDECITHCPDGYYDPPEVHTRCKACAPTCLTCAGPSYSDCLSCRNPFFLMESWSECVQVCDQKFYEDIETNTCIQCAPLCSKCEGSPNYCSACEPHALLSSDNTCLSTCSTNEYLEGSACHPCDSTCHTCSGSQDNDCLSCVPGSVLKERTCVEEWRCTDGYYVERGSLGNGKECLRCHVSCKNCKGQSSSECTECNTGDILQDGACIKNCLAGYFKDSNDDCLTCSYGCDHCTEEDNCVQCQSEFVLVDGTCKQGCIDGSYEHEGSCLSCHSLCETCIGGGPKDCTSCKLMEADLRYLLEGACVPFCPEGQYEDQQTLKCEECDETCRTCSGSEVNNCQSCYDGFLLNGDVCQEQEGKYCDPKCKECMYGSEDRCSSCNDGKYLQEFECVDNCAAGYFADEIDECVRCNPSCKTCSGASSQDCTSCNENRFLYDSSTCDSHCPYTTYVDRSDGTCKDCHSTCQSCSGPGSDACETCEGNLFWSDNECVSACPNSTYGDEGEQQCMKCYPTCKTCDGPLSENCLTCIAGLKLTGSICKQGDCPHRTYKDGDVCNDCHDTCQTCKGPEADDCQMCDYDRFLNEENQCIEVCNPGYYPDYENNICRPCHSSCKTCVMEGPQDCMDCENGMYILSNEDGVFCVNHCPEGFYVLEEGPDDDRSLTCQMCSPQCLDCSSSYSHCISCRDNTFLFRDQCIPSCPGGFMEDVESNRCLVEDRICPLHCTSCNEWGECLACKGGYQIYYGECMQPASQCAEYKYRAVDSSGNTLCRDCIAHCKRCLGPRPDECLACDTDYQLNNGHCRQNCNAKQFDQDGVCVACHPSCETCEGPSPYECTACPEGMVHTTSNSNLGECSIGCPEGTFRDQNQCLACHDTCQNCDGNSQDNCLSCKPHFFLTGNQRCVQTCPDGTYHYLTDDDSGSPSEFECRPCHSSCNTCYGPLERECTTCHDSMYRLDHECVAHCGTGNYPGKQSVCQPCHFDCISCWGNGDNQCITCANGKKLLDGLCVDECPLDHYLSLDFGAVCKPCHVRCKTCYDMGPFNCLSCHEGYELEDNVCYSRCDLGTYYINHTQHCMPCDPKCQECYGATDKHCIACHSGQSLSKVDDEHYTCLSCCKEGLDEANCCQCNKDEQCMELQGNDNSEQPVVGPKLNHGAIVFVCFLVLAVFGLFFGLLQARSRKKLCWKNTYEQLPAFYSNKGEQPKITLRQNALPSSDEDDYFDDSEGDI
ncbi:proprotein convertase subtilisin/kexin type 5-like isoform X2 [Patiria miniata]|uniref:P/Homo B domain-containing protein n=1 Tax=Patiria miniata TaxID=46514 RepID=A0A914A4S7_PATMI|nr:proprotein convertase subtilisin/kexin type 5-like isoform X2 [Patiria miniata]